MQEMNYQVTVQHRKASQVAHEYLVKHHLIKSSN
jgi:osmoprotectant transport system permease protein